MKNKGGCTMKEFLEMQTEDIEACSEIYMQAFPSNYYSRDKQPFVRYFSPFIGDYDKYAYVLKENDVVLGFITALRRPSILENEHIFIDVFAVKPEYQKQGNGSFMLNEFLNSFSGKAFIMLETKKNIPSYQMYKKMGFALNDGIISIYYNSVTAEMIKEIEELGAKKRNN